MKVRLTQYAHGGGCACKIPPGELEEVVARLAGPAAPRGPGELVVGLDAADDAAVVRLGPGTAIVATTEVESMPGAAGSRRESGGRSSTTALMATTSSSGWRPKGGAQAAWGPPGSVTTADMPST